MSALAGLAFLCALGLLIELWVEHRPSDDDQVGIYLAGEQPTAELEQLELTATTTRDRIAQAMGPAMRRAQLVAESSEVVDAIRSGDRKAVASLANQAIANATEVDLITFFDKAGILLGCNTKRPSGGVYPAEGINRLLELSFLSRGVVGSCLSDTHSAPVVEFQHNCDFSPLLTGSRGLAAAYSVPVRDPTTGEVVGVVSIRLWFDRLSSLLPRSHHVQMSLISSDGRVFSESGEQGDAFSNSDTLIVPREQVELMVDALHERSDTSALFTWRSCIVNVLRVSDDHTLAGGEIYLMAVADRGWILQDPRQQRVSHAIGMLAAALLILSAGAILWARSRGSVAVEFEVLRREAEEASRIKSTFLTHMSHEIRTPVTAVLGYLELLGEGADDAVMTRPRRQELVEIIRRNARHLLSIVDDVLDLARIESQQTSVRIEQVNPSAIARECIAALAPAARSKGISLRFDESVAPPAALGTDGTRLWQILMNIIGNAVKFTDRGEVVVTVRPLGPAAVEIRVRDTGCGIPPKLRDSLFKPFTQLDASMTRERGGAGLGLVITKHYLELLGGSILIDSMVDHGTTMILRFPSLAVRAGEQSGPLTLAVPEPLRPASSSSGEASSSAAQEKPPRDALRGIRVLVVEDYEDNQALLRYYLESVGAEATLADNGETAIIMIGSAHRAFDIVLMDMQMPVLDGYSATAELRAKGYRGVVIALTAHTLGNEREKCLAAGCTDYLAKPVSLTSLVTKVREHLPTTTQTDAPLRA